MTERELPSLIDGFWDTLRSARKGMAIITSFACQPWVKGWAGAHTQPREDVDAALSWLKTAQALMSYRDRGEQPSASPDDLRALGWSVAVHNDYTLNGERYTFWLMVKDGRALKGEGRTDWQALNLIRTQLVPKEET